VKSQMTKQLSPAAQAVHDAAMNTPEHVSYMYDIAAALRAAALYCKRDRLILLSLAGELEDY